MICWACAISCDIVLKRYLFFWGRVPGHWLKLQSLGGDCPSQETVPAEVHFWILPQSLATCVIAFPRAPQLLHDHTQFWTCEAQRRERM